MHRGVGSVLVDIQPKRRFFSKGPTQEMLNYSRFCIIMAKSEYAVINNIQFAIKLWKKSAPFRPPCCWTEVHFVLVDVIVTVVQVEKLFFCNFWSTVKSTLLHSFAFHLNPWLITYYITALFVYTTEHGKKLWNTRKKGSRNPYCLPFCMPKDANLTTRGRQNNPANSNWRQIQIL